MRSNIIITLICVLLISLTAHAQRSYSLSVFNNATQLPITSYGVTWQQIHPGGCAGYEFHWSPGSPWFQAIKVGYYYHQFVQSGIQFYTEFGYRKLFDNHFFVEASVCFGYLQTIPLTEQARLNSNGVYERENGIGRAQLTAGLTPGLGYQFKLGNRNLSIFTTYQIWIQLPYAPGLAPLLPNGSTHIGVRFPLTKNHR